MKKYKLIIGVDVSKNKLDVCFLTDPDSKQQNFLVVSNDSKGIKKILTTIKKAGFGLNDSLLCFENTGVYSMSLAFYLDESEIDYWEVPAIEIKRAKGISRGKNDKTDAKDIAFYAHTHLHKLKLSKLPEKDIIKLRLLYSEREKLLKSIKIFEATNEIKPFIDKGITKDTLSINKKTLRHLYKILRETEQRMQEIIKSNQEMSKQNELIQTIPGVGPQTAIYLIISTKCFKAFSNWRKLACYAGVAPFEYTSGSSIRGRTKVNHLADKKMKSLLTMCALNAKKHDKEIALYYQRKVKEGKNPMLVMNSIRCKVLSRVFATVNR
jgi:transposase